jgi:hypothetical protein
MRIDVEGVDEGSRAIVVGDDDGEALLPKTLLRRCLA